MKWKINMQILDRIFRDIPVLTIQYLISYLPSIRKRKLLDNIKTYFMFIGYPRSGHSLIGSLLDAHPDMICAQELGVLKYILAGFSQRQVFYLLQRNSKEFYKKGRVWSKYSYPVPNQWQGRYRNPYIIGDKQGGGAVLRLKARPWLLDRLNNRFRCQIKFLHVMRNPYDNITTISERQDMDLKDSIKYYFSLCETVQDIRKRLKEDDLFELRHESFISNPQKYLGAICAFLGAEASEDYLDDCESIVFKSPRETRYNAHWSDELISLVKTNISRFSFLNGYSYEE